MEPVTIIVAALAAGAAAALKSTAERAIKDAYAGLKALIQRKYESPSVEALEQKPDSEAKRASVAEDLKDTGASADTEVLMQAKALLQLIEAQKPGTAAVYGVDIGVLKAEANLEIANINSTEGTAVRIKEAETKGDAKITGVTTGKKA